MARCVWCVMAFSHYHGKTSFTCASSLLCLRCVAVTLRGSLQCSEPSVKEKKKKKSSNLLTRASLTFVGTANRCWPSARLKGGWKNLIVFFEFPELHDNKLASQDQSRLKRYSLGEISACRRSYSPRFVKKKKNTVWMSGTYWEVQSNKYWTARNSAAQTLFSL